MQPKIVQQETGESLQPRPRDVLADVYALRRKITIGVYAVITGDLPLYYLTGYTLLQVLLVAVVGWIVAGGSIYLAFRQIIRLRKRTSYPELLLIRLGDTVNVSDAEAEALFIIEGLLETQSCFIAIKKDDAMEVITTRGLLAEEAKWVMEAHASQLEAAMSGRYPADVLGEGSRRAAFVPIVALKRPIGVLYVATAGKRTLLDRTLLNDIGGALGLSLDNLHQKEQLLQKESRLRNVITGAPVVLFSVNNAGIVVFHQGQAMERVGVSPDTLIGRAVTDIYANYPEILQSFRRAFAGDEVVSTATIEAAGNRVMFEYRLAPERDDHGRVTGVIGVATDITQRTLAADALRESERFLTTLVGNLPGFVMRFETTAPGLIQYVSEGVKDVTGLAAQDLVGRPIAEFGVMVNDDDRREMIKRIRTALDLVSSFECEFRVLNALGDEKWLWQQGQVVTDEDGQPVAIEAFTMDVTARKQAQDALAESERFLSTLVGNLPGFVLRADIGSGVPTILFVSGGVRDVTGLAPEELIGQPVTVLADTMEERDRWRLAAAVKQAAETSGHFELEFPVRHPDGHEIWLWEQAQIVTGEDGHASAIEAFIMDVTTRKLAEQALEASEERFRDIYENARDAMITFDFRGHFLSVNRRMVELFGYTEAEFLEMSPSELTPLESQAQNAEYLRRVFRGDATPFEVELIAKDGHLVPMEMTARIAVDAKGRPHTVQMIGRDISERKLAEETIRRLAYHDALTGLPNRALFEDRLVMALAQARRQREMLGVLFLDLDGFKLVNDTLGHSAGDKLLQSVADDLALLIRDGDTVARVGGDEFTLLLPGIEEAEEVTDIARRILERLRHPRVIAGQEFRATASIGVTTFPADGEDGETLLRNADTAMYRAKEHGRDNYQLYTAAMNARMVERLSFEQSLRRALERDELKVFYQPIVDIRTGRITAAEALVRWFHPTQGMILPDEFIPLAEETGIILEIGESVLRQACRQIIEWQRQGVHVGRVAVNLSARQLQQEDLVARVAAVLEETGVSADLLQLEITEGAVLKNVECAISMLHQLREMGLSIALDDFGTGYSSLTYLKRFPVDVVKVDRTFVRDLEQDVSDAAIVSTVIAMGDSLGLRVVAEGVETEHQLEFLRARGCREFQGFLFSVPLPPDQFAELFLKSLADGPEPDAAKDSEALPAA